MKHVVVLPLVMMALSALPAQAAQPPRVAVSIAPLHGLVSAVMEGVGAPHLIVAGSASPHGYALRPSDAKAITDADLVVWVGPSLETFLVRPLEALGTTVPLTLETLPGIHRLPLRQSVNWEPHDHDEPHGDHGPEEGHDHEHDHEHDHDHETGIDPHLWLDIENAKTLVSTVAQRLSTLDPSHAATYNANATQALSRLTTLDGELQARLSDVRDRPFLVFHDAYQYIESHYGLTSLGSMTLHPDTPLSAGRLHELRERVKTQGVVCVFAEPQFPTKLIETVIEGTPARPAHLDPLGSTAAPGPLHYETTLRDLASSLHDCLSPSTP